MHLSSRVHTATVNTVVTSSFMVKLYILSWKPDTGVAAYKQVIPLLWWFSYYMYNITCIQRPPNESNKNGLLQQVVYKCSFYSVDLRRGVVSGQWSLKAVDAKYRTGGL